MPTWRGIRFRAAKQGRAVERAVRRCPLRVEQWIQSHRRGVHQLSHHTKEDRYPAIFDAACGCLRSEGAEVLSFGCSTGEEPAALAERLPTARIVGADMSSYVLKRARRRYSQQTNISFVNAAKSRLNEMGPFDAIFAMSVLCRKPATESVPNCSEIYPFERFEEACSSLDALLRPGGYLVLYNTNYRFTDTVTATGYEVIDFDDVRESGDVVKFDIDGSRSYDQIYAHCVFRKARRREPSASHS
jgi:SAM-dependent methyltransferase